MARARSSSGVSGKHKRQKKKDLPERKKTGTSGSVISFPIPESILSKVGHEIL
jgi:hypothetical protein